MGTLTLLSYGMNNSIVTETYNLDEMSVGERMDLAEKLIQEHDKYFQMSDDPRVYQAGLASLNRIKFVTDTLSDETTNLLWDRNGGRGPA